VIFIWNLFHTLLIRLEYIHTYFGEQCIVEIALYYSLSHLLNPDRIESSWQYLL